jgi:two-component system, NarL family, response regulator
MTPDDHRIARQVAELAMTCELTMKEVEVLTLAAVGCTDRDIAAQLHLSAETVKSYMKRILGRLGARNRAHAVAMVLCSGTETGRRAEELAVVV